MIVNVIVLLIKHVPFKKRWVEKTIPNRHKVHYQNHMNAEIYLGTITDNKERVLGKWSSSHKELSKV